MRLQPLRGSHLPVLMKLIQSTTGPVLEVGCGTYSTQYLHWACFAAKRRLVTYENNPTYFEYIMQFARDYHEIRLVKTWADIDVSEPWDVALVDNDPPPRSVVIAKLAHAQYVVCHDTERGTSRRHGIETILPLFKYAWRYRDALPNTSVFSNFHDVTNFSVL